MIPVRHLEKADFKEETLELNLTLHDRRMLPAVAVGVEILLRLVAPLGERRRRIPVRTTIIMDNGSIMAVRILILVVALVAALPLPPSASSSATIAAAMRW